MKTIVRECAWVACALAELVLLASLTWVLEPLGLGDSESRLGPLVIAIVSFLPLLASIATIWGVAMAHPRSTRTLRGLLIVVLACTFVVAFSAVYGVARTEVGSPMLVSVLLWLLLATLLVVPRIVIPQLRAGVGRRPA